MAPSVTTELAKCTARKVSELVGQNVPHPTGIRDAFHGGEAAEE
jgi:hypothetical protein